MAKHPLIKFLALGTVAAGAAAIWQLFGNELKSLFTLKRLFPANPSHDDGEVWTMDVAGEYYFDEFLEAGGAANDAELISFITRKIGKGIIPTTIEESDITCSSFMARAQDGRPIFGRNYDFKRTNTCIVRTHPGGGRHASVSTVDLQFLGVDPAKGVRGPMDRMNILAAPYAPLDGINDAGLACGIYMSLQGGGVDEHHEMYSVPTEQSTGKPSLTSTTMLRLILDYASTVDEAIELAGRYDLHDSAHNSFHYMVADASGKSAILEWTSPTLEEDKVNANRELKVIFLGDPVYVLGEEEREERFQLITNFILCEPRYYTSTSEMLGIERYRTMQEELDATDGIVADEGAALEVLQSVGQRLYNATHGDLEPGVVTVHSVVFDLKNRKAWWVPNEHFEEPLYWQVLSV